MTKLLTYAICAFTALSVLAAPVDFGDIAADYPLYDSSDPFAIGVSTAAYTSATNANARLDALMLSNATTITNISTYVTAQHANRTDNPHSVTAAQVGALTAEADTLATVLARGQIASNTLAIYVTDTALSPAPGLYGSSVYSAGVNGYSVNSRGVYGGTLGGYGVQAEATGSGTGIFAYAATSGVGVYSPHAIISEASITAGTGFYGSGTALTGSTGTTLADHATVTNIVLANLTTTADIRTPLVNVTTGATSTVTVTSAKRVYYVESSAQTTVTNDISALALNCTSNAEWEVWYNATSTNALAPAWDSRIEWNGASPEMTVTGVYKFALYSPCGTRIQARQTWPERNDWAPLPFKGSIGVITSSGSWIGAAIAQTNNNGAMFSVPTGRKVAIKYTIQRAASPGTKVRYVLGRIAIGSGIAQLVGITTNEFSSAAGTASHVTAILDCSTIGQGEDFVFCRFSSENPEENNANVTYIRTQATWRFLNTTEVLLNWQP